VLSAHFVPSIKKREFTQLLRLSSLFLFVLLPLRYNVPMQKYFSTILYKEALLRLRLVGGITSGLLLVTLIASVLTLHYSDNLLILYAWIAPIVMGFRALSFLWNPEKARQQLSSAMSDRAFYASSVFAVLTWTFVTLVLALVVRELIFAVMGTFFFETAIFVHLSLLFLTVLFGVSVAIFSTVISGSRLLSMIIAALIIALPPLLKGAYVQIALQFFPAITAEQVPLLGHNIFYTIVPIYLDQISEYIGHGLLYTLTSEAQDIVYTLAYAAFFFVAGMWFFLRRDPNLAGKNKLNLPFKFLKHTKE